MTTTNPDQEAQWVRFQRGLSVRAGYSTNQDMHMPTQQEIATRIDELQKSGTAAYFAAKAAYEAKVGAEMKSLQELCGSAGHVWRRTTAVLGRDGTACAICAVVKADDKP